MTILWITLYLLGLISFGYLYYRIVRKDIEETGMDYTQFTHIIIAVVILCWPIALIYFLWMIASEFVAGQAKIWFNKKDEHN